MQVVVPKPPVEITKDILSAFSISKAQDPDKQTGRANTWNKNMPREDMKRRFAAKKAAATAAKAAKRAAAGAAATGKGKERQVTATAAS